MTEKKKHNYIVIMTNNSAMNIEAFDLCDMLSQYTEKTKGFSSGQPGGRTLLKEGAALPLGDSVGTMAWKFNQDLLKATQEAVNKVRENLLNKYEGVDK